MFPPVHAPRLRAGLRRASSAVLLAVLLSLPALARPTRPWLRDGVVAQVSAKEIPHLPDLAARGVTVVTPAENLVDDPAEDFVAAAHAAGLKALLPVGFANGVADRAAHVYTNLLPRIAASRADGWFGKGTMSGTLEEWSLIRPGLDALRPGAVLVSDGSRLGNQVAAFDADLPPPWTQTFDAVLKGRKPVSELPKLWAFMRANRPEGARFLRTSPHWDPVPIAFAMCLDGIPCFTPGQARAACARDVLPLFARLRAQEPALRTGELRWLDNDRPSQVASFVRTAPDGRALVCVFNLSKDPLTVKVALPGALADAPLASAGAAFADGAYVFSGPGYDIRARAGALAVSAERAARRRAVAAAKAPRARAFDLKGPGYGDPSRLTARAAPPGLKGAVMYQLFLRMFTRAGTLKAAEARLGWLKDLGVDLVYLCPVAEADRGTDRAYWSARQKGSRLDNPANPYRISNYFAVDPEYGTEQDLKDFVRTAHAHGLKVYFDLVYYHCGPHAVFLQDKPEWVLRKADGSFELGEWAFPRLDVGNPEVREYLYENMVWYLREFGCDGFRCDVGDMLPLGFREEAYRRCRAVRDDVVMMCEGHDATDQQVAFDLNYAFPMLFAIQDFLKGTGSATNLSVSCVARESRYPKGYRWMRCFQNHDFANCGPGQERWEKKYGTVLNDALLATIFTLDGVPMVYNGQEVADTAPHSIWSDREHGRMGVDWSNALTPAGARRRDLVRKLADLRHRHPALFDAPTEFLPVPCPHDVYVFRRPLPDGSAWLTAVNISAQPRAVAVPDAFSIVLAADGVRLDPAGGQLQLPPHGWAITNKESK